MTSIHCFLYSQGFFWYYWWSFCPCGGASFLNCVSGTKSATKYGSCYRDKGRYPLHDLVRRWNKQACHFPHFISCNFFFS